MVEPQGGRSISVGSAPEAKIGSKCHLSKNPTWNSVYVRSCSLRAALAAKYTCKKFRREHHDQLSTIATVIDHLYTLKVFKRDSEISRQQRPYQCR
jgi:hypothetical protein